MFQVQKNDNICNIMENFKCYNEKMYEFAHISIVIIPGRHAQEMHLLPQFLSDFIKNFTQCTLDQYIYRNFIFHQKWCYFAKNGRTVPFILFVWEPDGISKFPLIKFFI